MKIYKLIIILFFLLEINVNSKEINMILKLKNGEVKIELFEDVAPNHVKRIKKLADEKKYDGVVFHRVIEGFMAQTGDVMFGNSNNDKFSLERAGMGGSNLPDLKQEFNSLIQIVLIVNSLSVLNLHLFLTDNTQFLVK